MTTAGEIELSIADLRLVARYAALWAQTVLAIFEESRPDDDRPRAAVEAVWTFVEGAPRTNLQRSAGRDDGRRPKASGGDSARGTA
ncbi:putative immunity protein [Speluncibacter jeojiensis]|uniref:Imm-5-like domain-containing protein n=1 Tax=Speluncibacter jeojiensis TaxID=2710754 RepID=A0A9X4M868_9ACTN|nr:hypothetical protein [Corynebacteriales bacterium D3-21]